MKFNIHITACDTIQSTATMPPIVQLFMFIYKTNNIVKPGNINVNRSLLGMSALGIYILVKRRAYCYYLNIKTISKLRKIYIINGNGKRN